MPRRLVMQGQEELGWAEYEDPPLSAGEIRVRTEFAAPKHGTSMKVYRGDAPGEKQIAGRSVGNQWVGRVTQVGPDVDRIVEGDRVCGYGGIQPTHTVTPERFDLMQLPEEVPWKTALCFDPAQYALGGLRDANVRIGDRVAVFGLGAIGQLTVQLAARNGASYVAAVDPFEKRRNAARELGATAVIDPTQTDAGEAIDAGTDGNGVDAVVETSGDPRALEDALVGLAHGGTIGFVAWASPSGRATDFSTDAHFNNAHIVFSRVANEPNHDHPRWDFERVRETCWRMVEGRAITGEPVIDPVVPFEEAAAAFEHYVATEPAESIKLGVMFPDGGRQ